MVQERRKSPRIRAYLPVRLHRPDVHQAVETLTKDISLDGVRYVSPMLCPVSTELKLELVLPTGREQIETRVKTAWFRTMPESEQFESGVSFVELSIENQRRLSAYIDHLSRLHGLVPA